MNDILLKSTLEIAQLIKARKVSPVDVVTDSISRIQKSNPALNAVVTYCFESAIAQAKIAEERLYSSSPLGIFHGVPFVVKECIAVEGFESTFGSLLWSKLISKSDSKVVSILRNQGAIPVGMTNTSECCLWMESYNYVYGRTNNPYDIKRTSGGSSGGTAAIVASRSVPFGLGSDFAGSIRIPSSFCGVFGYCPTGNSISINGHLPFDRQEDLQFLSERISRFLKIGPISFHGRDLFSISNVISEGTMSNNLDNFSWKNLHVYLLPNPIIKFTHSTDKEIQQKVIEVGEVFTSNGAKVRFLDDSVFTNAFEIWKCEIYQRLDYSLRKIITNGKDVNLLKELLLMSFRKSKMTLPAIISCLWEDFFKPSKKQILLGLQKSRTVLSSLSKVLDNNSIIVMPVYPTSAMRHNNPIIYPIDWIYSGIFNALNLPAVSIPMGLNTHKLPLGIQIISAAHNDILILKAAELFDNK